MRQLTNGQNILNFLVRESIKTIIYIFNLKQVLIKI